MPLELAGVFLRLPVFLLVVGRLAGMLMFQPLLGGLSIPLRVRVLVVVGLGLMVAPLVRLPATAPDSVGGVLLALGHELLVGALIGLVIRLCFLALELAGLLIAQESGMAFAQLADPSTGAHGDVLGILYVQLGAVVYLILGGHRALVAACLDTFETIPLLSERPLLHWGLELLPAALTLGVQTAVRIAAPVLLTLILVNVALGLVGRTFPQLNIAILGFSIKGIIVFALIAASLPAALEVFTVALEESVGAVEGFLRGGS